MYLIRVHSLFLSLYALSFLLRNGKIVHVCTNYYTALVQLIIQTCTKQNVLYISTRTHNRCHKQNVDHNMAQ